jgi:hypothetical protein
MEYDCFLARKKHVENTTLIGLDNELHESCT